MSKKIFFSVFIILVYNFSYSQVKKTWEYAFTTGLHKATISPNLKGPFIQNSLSKKINNSFSTTLCIGIGKSSSFPKNFKYELAPFKIQDTMWGYNLELWNLVKNKKFLESFDLTEVVNIYLNFDLDISLIKINKFTLKGNFGINFISSFATELFLKDESYVNGKLVSYTPTAYYNNEKVIGFNTGVQFCYKINSNWGVHLKIDKYFGDNSTSGYSKAEWVNAGLGVSKSFNFKK